MSDCQRQMCNLGIHNQEEWDDYVEDYPLDRKYKSFYDAQECVELKKFCKSRIDKLKMLGKISAGTIILLALMKKIK